MKSRLHGSVLNCLAGLVRVDGHTHRHENRLHFRNKVGFLGMSHMTYGCEVRDTKMVVRERVKGTIILKIDCSVETGFVLLY